MSALALTSLLTACHAPRTERAQRALLPERDGVPEDVLEACAVTADRCTQCHAIDRVLLARAPHPAHWARIVDRMRLMPHSRITNTDKVVVLRCLNWRAFGRASGGVWPQPLQAGVPLPIARSE